jgi:hypothetical protein
MPKKRGGSGGKHGLYMYSTRVLFMLWMHSFVGMSLGKKTTTTTNTTTTTTTTTHFFFFLNVSIPGL